MHRAREIVLIASFAVASLPIAADQAKAQAAGCMACHQVAVKVVGPSYKDVAAKYQGDAAAKSQLIGKVRDGAVGVWGQVPMPPNAVISDADLSVVIDWILAQ